MSKFIETRWGHAKLNSCQIIFRLRNAKFYSRQNLLIYSMQSFSVLTSFQYSTQRQTSDASLSVLHHVTFKVTQGKRGLTITEQISEHCKVCTCVTMPCYKCLNYKGCWGAED